MTIPTPPFRCGLFRGAAALAALVLVAGCGAGSEASNEVASLNGDTDVETAAETDSTDTAQAALDFAQCMRDNGVDMEDPTFDADGNLQGGFGPGPGAGDGPGADFESEEVRTALDACQELLDGVAFGGPGGGDFDPSAISDGLLAYTSCLRDEGLNVDDITLGQPGADGAGPTPGDGDGPAGGFAGGGPPPGGQGGGPGGEGFDPTDLLIEQLGLDQDDPEVAAALETCAPVLDAAFSLAPGDTTPGDTTPGDTTQGDS